MTFEDLDRRFPNGLDDAEITAIAVDYEKRLATLRLNMRGNPPDSSDRDVYAPAVLRASGIYYVSIEPPDPEHLSHPKRDKITVDGLPEDPRDFPLLNDLKKKAATGAFCCRFFVHDWNSFIHIAAADAEFFWENDGGHSL
jgi:hypothetical protein